jgi:hypothetical protein
MKFADPLNVTCPGCGKRGSYSVESLLALEAKCADCGYSLAAIGEKMHSQIKEVRNFSIASRLTFEIEDFDAAIKYDDADFQNVSCLNDIAEVTARKLAPMPHGDRHSAAVELVQRAVASVFHRNESRGDLALADAFPEQARSDIWRGWRSRSKS